MRQTTLLTLFFCCFGFISQAQLNMNLLGTFDVGQDASDIWGYVAPDGTEYAVMGLNGGTVIFDLTDPTNPVQRDYISGASSTWRDIKTFGEYIYVVADEGADGLLVIDMTTHDQTGSLNHTFWKPSLTVNGTTQTLTTSHNLYIDANGVAYIAGSTLNSGGMLFVDVATDPMNPAYIGAGPAEYSHDVFVRNDTMWSSDINAGYFSVVDVSDKTNPVIMATQTTPFFFTHNAWLSDNGKTLFTTDERGDAPVAAYDVSDLNDIKFLDEFRPPATVGKGVIPHNVHVLGDYLVISYYTDGIVVVDASDPSNMIEVGYYDTFIGPDGGFSGSWGAYPFLPSGLVLASDINTGLYVLGASYVGAAYLEGLVTDDSNNQPLDDVTITIETTTAMASSDFTGNYKTGYAVAGTYDVTFQKATYEPLTVSVNLANGQTTVANAALTPLTPFTMSGKVVDFVSGDPVPNAIVKIENASLAYDAMTDAQGEFTLPTFYEGNDYSAIAGKWGYLTKELLDQEITPTNSFLEIQVESGYRDAFALDLGWTVSGDAVSGDWERDTPVETQAPIPTEDLQGDLGTQCYLTGNTTDLFGDNVSGGTTILSSPEFDLSGYANPEIGYSAFFFSVNFTGTFPPPDGDDSLKVFIENGTDRALVELKEAGGFFVDWEGNQFNVSDYLTPTSTMRLVIEVGDLPGTTSDITKAGVDLFYVVDTPSAINDPALTSVELTVSPNPFEDNIVLEYSQLETKNASISIYNLLGQPVERIAIDKQEGTLSLGKNWVAGVYFLRIESLDGNSKTLRLVKQ